MGFYTGVSRNRGIPLLGSSLQYQPGLTYFVHDSGNDSSNFGGEPDNPLKTIDAAINKLADVSSTVPGPHYIYVMAGHAESFSGAGAAGAVLDVNGTHIIGLGTGPMRPTITIDTNVANTFDITADGVALVNVLFTPTLDDTESVIDFVSTSSGVLIEAVEFRDNAGSVAIIDTIDVTSQTDIVFRNCRFDEQSTGNTGQSCILGTTPDRLVVEGCYFHKDAVTGIIELANATGFICTQNMFDLQIGGESLAIVLGTPVGGYVTDNLVRMVDAAAITGGIDGASTMNIGRNWITNQDAESGGLQNAVSASGA